mmetsp:Transcript_32310/g.75480  ORF Transcript_32310/g.75480 Transcript_32310/m.75480 type:complete len:2927 (-) Transcript_32310:112-8892(-)
MLLATQALRLQGAACKGSLRGRMSVRSGWVLALAVALVASAAVGVSGQTHKDSTRYKTHTNDNGMTLAQGNVGDPGTRGFKDPAQYLNPHTASETQGARLGTVLARSNPAGSTDGWQGVRQTGVPSSTKVVSDAAAGVSGSDSGSEVWYFMAPTDRFAGDLASAYNGRLSFTLTHSETPSSAKATRAPDVILEASCGHSLMLYGLAEKGGALSVMLNEDAGWIDSRTRRPPGVMDFLGVLSHLAAVKVRGGYYSGSESTRLSAVSLTSGKAWYPCCTMDGTVDICQKKPSSYYNPPNLRYYCEGHMYRPVRVTRVLPRFSRRTGGSAVTVIGENFGLAGSSPIVRINGKPCQKTYFPPSVVRNDYNTIQVSSNSNTHLLAGTGDALVQPSNPAGNALVNAYSSASDSMKQRYPEHCWNGMQDDGTDKGYNYGTATAPKYIDQGEQGVDTGGPCFPLHCSSCPVPTAVGGSRIAGMDWNLGSGIFVQPHSGTVVATGSTTDATLASDASTADDFYKGMVWTQTCSGTTLSRIITGYVGSTKVVTLAVAATGLATTCTYKISPFLDFPTTGTATGGSTTTLVMATTGADKADVGTGHYHGLVVTITSGPAVGESRLIDTHTAAGTVGWTTAMSTAPTTASTYVIHSPDLRGRCSKSNQIAAFGSGDCKGRALTTAGTSSACSARFPYVKYPSFCPEDAEYSSTLNSMFTNTVTGSVDVAAGTLRSTLQRGIWGVDGIYASVDKEHKMVEGVTRVTHPNPLKTDTSTATTAVPTKAKTIEVEDAVALCGISVDGNLGAGGAATVLNGALDASETTTITVTGDPRANTAYFGLTGSANAAGWTSATVLNQGGGTFGYGYVLIGSEIIKVSAAATTTLTIAQRGAFGTPITTHATASVLYGVSVCRGAVLSFSPATGQRELSASYPSLTPAQGTAQGGSTTTITLAAAGTSAVDGYYVGMNVAITTAGAGGLATTDVRRVVSYDGTTKVATVEAAWASGGSPDGATVYVITTLQEGYSTGAATASTFTLALGASPANDYYKGMKITITTGTGVGLERYITGYVGSTRVATVNEQWTVDLTSKYAISPVSESVFYAVSYHNAECATRSQCTLTLSTATSDGEVLNKVNVGDVVRRVAAGRTTATTTLSTSGTALGVSSAATLFGATFLFDTAATRVITCGSDGIITVSAASLLSNQITTAAVDNVGTTCVPGSVVTVKSGVAAAGDTTDAYAGPGHFGYYTTFDAAGILDMADSDVADFAPHRYIQMGGEVMRITAVADGNSGADSSSRAANGLERLTVARGQLGTQVQAHPKGSKMKLLPRMAEVTVAMTVTDNKVYLPSGLDIVANNLGVVTQTALSIVAASALGSQTGISAQGGGTRVASYIKIDDEIMKVTGVTTSATAEGNEASLTVLRAQAGTLATAHPAGSMLRVMGCMDGDETGSNCGGSCKPCTAPAKGGPTQQDRLICITPEGVSGPGPSGQGAGDLAVTVEAAPGPKDSPFGVRMNQDRTALVDASVTAVSCISEQSRGFQYGAHDFVWGVHLKARDASQEVKITDIAVDRNTGDSYVVGTMLGTIYVQGKHIHMSKDFQGELEVSPANPTYIETTSSSAMTATTVTDNANVLIKDTVYANDYLGKLVEIVDDGGIATSAHLQGCTSRATTTTTDTTTGTITVAGFTKASGTCGGTFGNEKFRLHKGSAGFIAKFSKDGRPVWLNKLDTAHASNAHELVITSVAVDSTSGAHYLAGHFSDGWVGYDDTTVPTINYYNVDTTTRVAGTTAAGTIAALAADNYGQSPASANPGVSYQEGFILKYSSAGQFVAKEAIKGGKYAVNLVVSNLKVRAFHASTSSTLNTQARSDLPPPTQKTSKTQLDVEYDFGMATGTATLGGGTESRSSITLAATAAMYYPPSGQTLTNGGGDTGATEAMDDWYNGLTITITCGKGMGQVRTIVDYVAATRVAYVQPHWDGETMLPDTSSCYVITGKPSSHISGKHLASGGVYVTGNLWNRLASTNANNEYVCFGEMADAYRDTSSSAGIPVCAKMTVDNEEANFVAQYDQNLRSYWVRFIYDGQNTADGESDSGLIKAVETVDDLVFVAGTFGKNQWGIGTTNVQLRLQNCSFDSSPVAQGPPANSQPKVVTLKKLCRMQTTTLTDLGSFPVQQVNDLMLTGGTRAQTGARSATTHDFGILNTLATDYVELPTVAATAAAQDMYVAAYDGSGSLVWYHYTSPSGAAGTYSIEPTAIASVQPAIGNKPLTGHWKVASDRESLEGRGQPPDATAAKDISSERVDSATIRGGFVYVAGTVTTTTQHRYADFGITRQPLSCSRGKSVGTKDSTAAILNKMQDTRCAGHLQSLGQSNGDVFMAKYAALGGARTDTTLTSYGTGRQPDLQYVRRTGMSGASEVATGIAVHDLTGAAFVVGTYTATATTTYQGSNVGEKSYQASTGNDGGYVYSATREAGLTANSGEDHFGLKDANRVNAVGCPVQRFAPADEHEERLGLTGLPDCTFYSHAASTSTTTGFVVKFNDNGDETLRGNKNRKNIPSITGRASASGTCGTGATSTCTSSVTPCSGGESGVGETQSHVYTKTQACSTYPGGCSCIYLDTSTFSKASSGSLETSTGSGLSNGWSGRRIRITKGKAAGYEGVISAYQANLAADHVYFTVPALPEVPDHTSEFQIFGNLEPQPKIHLDACASSSVDAGCSAHGVEWAKTIGLPIGQTKFTRGAYGGPSNLLNGDKGKWKLVGGTGTAATAAVSATVGDTIVLNLEDAVGTASPTAYYDNYVIYMSTDTQEPFTNIIVGEVLAGQYTLPASAAAAGGSLKVVCRKATVVAGEDVALSGITKCPVVNTAYYRLVAKKDATVDGVTGLTSSGDRAESAPVSVSVVDGDVYIGGKFRGFHEFPFGVEGVDETVGYKSVGYDTWESYLVKLED